MNQRWTELNKQMQGQLKKSVTFKDGIKTLLMLREELMEQIKNFRKELREEDFRAMPFMNAIGYHNKTIAYSLYHIFRIEDIVTNVLIQKNEQIFNKNQFQKKINSPIITTGNELVKLEIVEFSKLININELYRYIIEVNQNTNAILSELHYEDLKIQMNEQDKIQLTVLNVVSEKPKAFWLINYWSSKTIKGLLQMPLSRHWIMHIDACIRIAKKTKKQIE